MRNNVLKVYLAGKMSGLTFDEMNQWRVDMKNLLNNTSLTTNRSVEIINPVDYFNFEETIYQSEEEIEEFDLSNVISSDIIVVNLDGLATSDGTKLEIHDAKYHNKTPVIAFGDRELYEKLHPWTKHDITRVEPDMNGVVSYIKRIYLT